MQVHCCGGMQQQCRLLHRNIILLLQNSRIEAESSYTVPMAGACTTSTAAVLSFRQPQQGTLAGLCTQY